MITQERRKARYKIVYDPGQEPLEQGLTLNNYELTTGVRLMAFYVGTLIYDTWDKTLHRICLRSLRLVVIPPIEKR